MTKAAALHQFFNSFGIKMYPVSNVPTDATFPWGTYELVTGYWESGDVSISVNLYYYGDREAEPNAKAQEISKEIGLGGKIIRCDGGAIWLKRGSPWCQNIVYEDDTRIKRRFINITAEYFTQD